jgi:hypothetical protein
MSFVRQSIQPAAGAAEVGSIQPVFFVYLFLFPRFTATGTQPVFAVCRAFALSMVFAFHGYSPF